MPQEYVDKGVFRKKPTYAEILSSIERDGDKIQLPERTALTFWDSFAMGQYKEMLQTSAAGQQAQGERIQMDTAMTHAATEEGLNRQQLASFMRDMNTQNTAAQHPGGADAGKYRRNEEGSRWMTPCTSA